MTKTVSFWLGFFLFSVYLLSFSGRFHVMDELAVFTAGHNLAQYGRADTNQLIWTNHWTPNPPGIWGSDGNLYTKKAPGISFITAPLIWLGLMIPGLNAVHVGLLTNSFVTALTASILFMWLTDLGFSRTTSAFTTLGYGLCTISWVYARMFWESSLLALTFLVAVWAVYRAVYLGKGKYWLLLSGVAIAVSLSLRFEALPATLFITIFLAMQTVLFSRLGRRRNLRNASPTFSDYFWKLLGFVPQPNLLPLDKEKLGFVPQPNLLLLDSYKKNKSLVIKQLWQFVIFLFPTLLVILALFYFNLVRFGSLSETGYTRELLFNAPWVGGFGLLFSPGRGLFIYAPFMLLLFFGIRPAWQRLPRPYFWLIAALCLFYWLFYGSWFAWGGTWGWGPRFLLPILPLLMLFVAEPVESANQRIGESASYSFVDLLIIPLVLVSIGVNLLGIMVDFNEHFMRLGRNDNFLFNWAAFPPIAHWYILQEGLVDIIWLHPGVEGGLIVDWAVLAPALALFLLASVGLTAAFLQKNTITRPLYFITPALLLLLLTYLMMSATARLSLENTQTQLDLPILNRLAESARPGDVLHIPMPPFGDVQEITTLFISYLSKPLPTSIWIESEPRAIQPDGREQVWRATAEAKRVWLFERWLTQEDPIGVTATRMNREAFPIQEQWFEKSGRLTLYAMANNKTALPIPINVPFKGGLTLVDFTVLDNSLRPGETVKLRLIWRGDSRESEQAISVGELIVFVQLLDTKPPNLKAAQNDRLLVDLQNINRSPLLPGQTVPQGYGLQLPNELPPGTYSLVVGLYQANTGQRLIRTDDSTDDFIYLTDITVR